MKTLTLTLTLITQERKVLEEEALSVTLPGQEGELTVLPHHVNLFTELKPGIISIKTPQGTEDKLVTIDGGFADIGPTQIKILAESALRADEIDEAKVKQAQIQAQEALKNKTDRQKYIQAETSLRKAILHLKTAKRWKKMKKF